VSLRFQYLVAIANRVAAEFDGSRDTCVLTSFALNDVLQRLGHNSRPLRIEAAVFPDDRKLCGTILGAIWSEPGSRRGAAPGCGRGTLQSSSTIAGSWTPHSIRRTKKSGRRPSTSARSQSVSRKTSGSSEGRSWFGPAAAPCGSLRTHGKLASPRLATLGHPIGSRLPIGSSKLFSPRKCTFDRTTVHIEERVVLIERPDSPRP
jgi:hypothetical protein